MLSFILPLESSLFLLFLDATIGILREILESKLKKKNEFIYCKSARTQDFLKSSESTLPMAFKEEIAPNPGVWFVLDFTNRFSSAAGKIKSYQNIIPLQIFH